MKSDYRGVVAEVCARLLVILIAFAFILAPLSSEAADKDRVEAFLDVTGFDVALDSIALSAETAPQMLGIDADTFGSDWKRLSDQVFDTSVMHKLAVEILEQTLTDTALTHAVTFYASDLGQRLVLVENESHLDDDETRVAEGKALLDKIRATDSHRLTLLERMNAAIDTSGSSLRAIQEVQIRFLLAASAAGIVELSMDPEELRAMFRAQEPELLPAVKESALAGAAYTYREFSDEDIEDYVIALEHPEMRQVYELLNAVQFEIMANRFEVLATRMSDLHPGQDI